MHSSSILAVAALVASATAWKSPHTVHSKPTAASVDISKSANHAPAVTGGARRPPVELMRRVLPGEVLTIVGSPDNTCGFFDGLRGEFTDFLLVTQYVRIVGLMSYRPTTLLPLQRHLCVPSCYGI
jgi:hypothetical protein